MKIRDVERRIDASYNTIKKFIEKNDEYYELINGITHVTDKGLEELEIKYGLTTEVLSDDSVVFYKNQIHFLKQQLEENKQYNKVFLNQLELKNNENEVNSNRIKELENQIHKQDLEKLELKYELELERNKSIFKKIFNINKRDS